MHATLVRLDAEWRELAASMQSTQTLEVWQRHDPALGEGGDLDDLLARRRDPSAARPILAGLARLAPEDPLAARVLLQALIPGLVRLATTAGYDDPFAIDELVSLAWERIRTYPTTRHGSVAANVLLDTRKRYRKHRDLDAPRSQPRVAELEVTAPSAETVVMNGAVIAELADARVRGLVTDDALDLIVRTRLQGESLEAVAAERGCPVACLAQRRWRAEKSLRSCLQPMAS